MKIPNCGALTSYRRGLSGIPLPLFGSLTFPHGLSHPTQTQGTGLGLPSPAPHTTILTEGTVLGNPKSQDQTLRVAVLKLGLEGLLKPSWEDRVSESAGMGEGG